MLAFRERAIFSAPRTGVGPPRRSEGAFCPYDSYRAADGWLGVWGMTPARWAALCGLLERREWVPEPRFATGVERARHRAEIDPVLERWLGRLAAVDASARLRAAG